MAVMFLIWLLATVLEATLYYATWGRRQREVTIALTVALLAFASGGGLALELSGYTVLFALFSLYRIFNLFRIVQDQVHEHYRARVTRRTFVSLTIMQIGLAGLWLLSNIMIIKDETLWATLATLQVAVSVIALISVMRTLRRTRWPKTGVHLSDKELPTITVAIPARNETDDLHACLQGIIASDYPKLEILVLDDCSQTKRTPEIIRSFAHSGVRFIQGVEPPATWLAKNWAYEQLAREASGDYILFCGVDVRFDPHAIRRLITVMLERKKTVISILPERSPAVYGVLSLIQPMRYWWELVPPRRLFNRPPVLSTCWIIEEERLQRDGSFAAVSRAIVPEAYFAKKATAQDAYSFMRSSSELGIYNMKRISDQRSTATRMRYPQTHRRPEQVALLSLVEGTLLVLPFVMAVAGFWVYLGTVTHYLALTASILLIITHELVAVSTRVNSWWFGLLAAPWMFILDILYLHYSMWRYEFSSITWKGRNVCAPVMHAIPRLPETDKH